VRDARYFRSQAELRFELARQMQDPQQADSWRLSAAEYLAQAVELEVQATAPIALVRPQPEE
jgi:hypothetical protein